MKSQSLALEIASCPVDFPVVMASQAHTPPTYTHQEQGFNKALLRETTGLIKGLIRPYFWGDVNGEEVDQP